MNINLDLYKVFYHVAKNKNISKTANELLISQPSISKSIKNLEEQVGCQLFIRSKYGVVLTDEGRIFYEQIKTAMEIIDAAEVKLMEMINLDAGILSIGVSNTLTQKYLMPYIRTYHRMYPNIKIKIITGPTHNLINQARNGIIDLIILNLPYVIPNDFKVEKLKTIQDAFFATNEFSYLKNKKIKLEDLNSYPLILISKGSNTRYFLDNFTSSNKVNLIPEMELSSYSLVTEFTKLGLGIGYLTKEFLDSELDNSTLFELDIEPKIPKRDIGYIHTDNKRLGHASYKFIELLKNN